jgi:hypothetical protein
LIETILDHVVPPALAFLPFPRTQAAVAMLLAVGLQETRFIHRRQLEGGPARSFWQFEAKTVELVMRHEQTRTPAQVLLGKLKYQTGVLDPAAVFAALEHNDVLACGFARMLLWTLPAALPLEHEEAAAWKQYLEAWRPGKPHPETWSALYLEAWTRAKRLHSLTPTS